MTVPAHPKRDSWTISIHADENDSLALGGGVVIDEWRILTCWHVVAGKHSDAAPLWVAFPKAGISRSTRRQVAAVRGVPDADLAVVELAEPVPMEVQAAPLRCVDAAELVGEAWWAFGFPHSQSWGNDANGHIGAELSYGAIRLDTGSRYVVEPGFSGTGVWSPRFGAIVALVTQARTGGEFRGDAFAMSLYQVDKDLPEEKIGMLARWSVAAAGEQALAAWGWALIDDIETGRHWAPRARGVAVDSERGQRFRGRRHALTVIVDWLDRPIVDSNVLIVTGSPGVGKSAVLGRIVTTADAQIRAALPAADDNVTASVGSVACAVHVKGKTADDVAEEITRAAGIRHRAIHHLPAALLRRLTARGGLRFNLIIDALDEATDPDQTRAIIDEIVLPIARTCGAVGAQIVIGTRRHDHSGDLLARFGPAVEIVDLDDHTYFVDQDLTAYTMATLQLVGDERSGNPYADDAVAAPVAARIAQLADRNFLVAGLVARRHGVHDTVPIAVADLVFPPDVGAALTAYIDVLSPVGDLPATTILAALAYAEAPGLTVGLWQTALAGLGARLNIDDLTAFAESAAANFIVESTIGTDTQRRFRLYHQALNDALLDDRRSHGYDSDERGIAEAMIKLGRAAGWSNGDPYLLRSLPGHAARAGIIDNLLEDDYYLLHADLPRLIGNAARARSDTARNRVRLLRLTPSAAGASPTDRVAHFSLTTATVQLGAPIAPDHAAPYRATWAVAGSRTEQAVLEGHTGPVSAVCFVPVEGRTLIASAGDDRTVRLWDPATGVPGVVLEGHTGSVSAVCAALAEGRSLIASASNDGTVRLWDLPTGTPGPILKGHVGGVKAVCVVSVEGRTLVVSAGQDRTVRLWDPITGAPGPVFEGHTGGVYALCAVRINGRTLIASGSDDRTIRLWDPTTDSAGLVLDGHGDGVNALCAVEIDGHTRIVSASYDRTVRLWDPVTGDRGRIFRGHLNGVKSVCTVLVDDRTLIASASDDRTVRLWDPATGAAGPVLEGHTAWVLGVTTVPVDGRTLVVSSGSDRTVRLWDPATDVPGPGPEGHIGWVSAICAVQSDGRPVIASAGHYGAVRLWDPTTGVPGPVWNTHTGGLSAVCAVPVGDSALIAAAGDDDTVQLWDPTTGLHGLVLEGHTDAVNAVCAVAVDGRTLIASGSDDGTVRLWDAITGRSIDLHYSLITRLFRRTGLRRAGQGVNALCALRVDGRVLIASAGVDRAVRLWDAASGHPGLVLEGHTKPINALCAVPVRGRTFIASGSADRTVRLWDPATGAAGLVLNGHTGRVAAICTVPVGGRTVIASASGDGTVRLWDPATGVLVFTIPIYQAVNACTNIGNRLIIGTVSGVLSLTISSDILDG